MTDTPDTPAAEPKPDPVGTDIPVRVADDSPAPRKRRFAWRRIIAWLLGLGAGAGVLVVIALAVIYIRWTDDLPTLEAVRDYKPAVMTRVHGGDGKLITEYSKEARVFVPVETIPRELQLAFVSAEDQRFYTHGGWDPIGLTRAALSAPAKKMRGQRIGGTSTLTQQVAKNFLVGDDYSMKRKVREIAIARRLETAFTKDEIVELYLNEIYFGRGAYGVAAASLNHFGKPMDQLDLAEMTYLAAVPKGPANYRLNDPRGFERAKNRQAYILGRMVEDGYITQDQADTAKAAPLKWIERLEGQEYLAAEYFNEEVRKRVFDQYGEDELYGGGLSIRTSLDTDMQLAARKALRNGLEGYDRRHGYRGPLTTIDARNWDEALAAIEPPKDIGDWQLAVILKAGKDTAEIGFLQASETDGAVDPDTGEPIVDDAPTPTTAKLPLSTMTWAGKALADGKVGKKPAATSDVFKAGDVILVEATEDTYALRQVPAVNGAIMAMDPHTGRVLALVGGYSFQQSQFNRATQAFRQPGSGFKPFVYAAAMENGYTPSSQILDAPFVIENADNDCVSGSVTGLRGSRQGECQRYYKPSNYSEGKWYGLSTLRLGLEKSRNAMTVRLANDLGMDKIESVAERFGIYDDVPRELAWSLGAGETTLFKLANAYSMMINGGLRVEPSIIDRVQDGTGKTIFRHPEECIQCYQDEWVGQPAPDLADTRERVIDPVTAYQTMFMMKGVVENGTGRTIAQLGRPLGGKTGTTNDYKDAWFMGFSPDLVAGVYVGFDTPSTMGREAGGVVAAPIFKAFMGEVLADEPLVPFRIPEGVSLAPVNRDTGEPSFIGAPNYILEAFRPGTEPQIGGRSGPSIGIGTGSGTFFGGSDSYDFGDTDDAPTDNPQTDTVPTNRDAGLNDVLDAAEDAMTDPTASAPIVPARLPDPTPEKVVEDIDDGLY